MTSTDSVLELLARGDSNLYSGERISQLEHALQCAHFAEQGGAGDALVVATLLHDIGHILEGGELAAERGVDAHHEELGADWLAARFGAEVSEPVRLHVAAKRYLCATDPTYFDRLSPASVRSLELQGGPMTTLQANAFDSTPHAADAVRLRQWDEQGKIVGLKTPGLEHYRPRVAAMLK